MNKLSLLFIICSITTQIYSSQGKIPEDWQPIKVALDAKKPEKVLDALKELKLDQDKEEKEYCFRLLLRYYVEENKTSHVSTLLESGADPLDVFSWGCTDPEESAIDAAKRLAAKDTKYKEIVKLLVAYQKS